MKPLAPVLFGLTVLQDIVMGAPKKDLGSAGAVREACLSHTQGGMRDSGHNQVGGLNTQLCSLEPHPCMTLALPFTLRVDSQGRCVVALRCKTGGAKAQRVQEGDSGLPFTLPGPVCACTPC